VGKKSASKICSAELRAIRRKTGCGQTRFFNGIGAGMWVGLGKALLVLYYMDQRASESPALRQVCPITETIRATCELLRRYYDKLPWLALCDRLGPHHTSLFYYIADGKTSAGGLMKGLLQKRTTVLALALLVLALLIISCAPNANEPIISPQLGPLLAAREAGEIVVALPTPTPVLLASLPEEQIYAGLPEDFAAALAAADPANAETIALTAGCVGCHNLDPAQQAQGPTWFHMGDTAAGRVAGEGPALYLYTSIVNPSAYIVPGYQDGIMPKTFGETLTTQQLADLVAYLLAQHQ
jgi:cytochrome c551/c552